MLEEYARAEKEMGAPARYSMSHFLHHLVTLLLQPLRILQSVRREHLTADVLAGLTVAAVAIPQAIAYASIAELPPHVGLYTAAIAAIVGSFWGCSRFLATGPVNASPVPAPAESMISVIVQGVPPVLHVPGVVILKALWLVPPVT